MPDTTFFLNRVETEAGAARARDDGQRRGLDEADRARPQRVRVGRSRDRRARVGRLGRDGVDRQAVRLLRRAPTSTSSRGSRRARRRSRAAAPDTTSSDASARCRSRRSPRSTAPASAAASRSRSTATRARSQARSATSRCPECFLGIIPAWGGTQLVPRLVDAETAVRFVVQNPLRQNRMLTGARGPRVRLRRPRSSSRSSSSTSRSRSRSSSCDTPLERQAPRHVRLEETIRRARSQLDDTVHGAAIAPYRALDLIEGAGSGWSLEEGYRDEEEAVADLLPQPPGAGLALRVRPRRAAREAEAGQPGRRAAQDQEGRASSAPG